MPIISSRQHALARQCRAIVRGDDPHLLLDGWHLLAGALDSGLRLSWVAIDTSRGTEDPALLDRARATGAVVVEVTTAVMEAMSPVRTASGLVAVCVRPTVVPRALLEPAPALVLAAFGVQDPGNVGALLRSADAAGATGILVDTHAADPLGWKALRASMGSVFRLPVLREAGAWERLHQWQRDGLRVVATDPHVGVSMHLVDFSGPTAIVLGAEGAGVPQDVLAIADTRVRVPMRRGVESLNVAVAGALLAYEAARQRGGPS